MILSKTTEVYLKHIVITRPILATEGYNRQKRTIFEQNV